MVNGRTDLLGVAAAGGIAIAALVGGCGAEPTETPATRDVPQTSESAGPPVDIPAPRVVGLPGAEVPASRRVLEGCDPREKAEESRGFAGGRALAILSWNGASERTADLEIPVYVVGVEDGSIGVRFLEFPMREEYLHIWLGSGHIEAVPESDTFRLDPCSARLAPWPYPAGASAADASG